MGKASKYFALCNDPNNRELQAITSEMGDIQYRLCYMDKVLPLYNESLKIYEDLYSHSHESVARIMRGIALVNIDKGNYDDAMTLLNDAQNILKDLYDYTHPKTIICISLKGDVYQSKGCLDEIIPRLV